MVYGLGNAVIKFLFFSANLLICVFGGLIFGFSLWANLDKNFAVNLEKLTKEIHQENLNMLSKYQASLWILVAVGALLFLVGFLGCCGALCESTLLLSLFFVIVLVLTFIEMGAAIFAITSKNQFKESLHKLLNEVSKNKTYMKNLKPIEDLFQCCGATVETQEEFKRAGLCEKDLYTKADCFKVITDWIHSTGEIVIVIAFILFVIELFALLSTCILCRAFRTRRPYYFA
ncbi:unnamed protein product [Dracunculus medinensis]|uniref:Tetraspanin n=1 Tax=Dracunculus medinensis TaxID=318479 RepID=A0A0N4UPY2_DRAME|nr:unnamed protein product [Dracunculus medinensis]